MSRHVTIRERDLVEVVSYETKGAYDFARDMVLYRVAAGKLAGRHVLADGGFRWSSDSHGSYRRDLYILPDSAVPAVLRAIQARDLCAAQDIAYQDYATVSTSVHLT